jgi:glycosyltransferase involved in cell wall biosynthesis
MVSIIVPSFNQGQFIGETIESILSQDYRPLQLIVIDGASSDETVKVLESFAHVPELEWVSEPDNGVVEAVNKGFACARGEILAIQSSDDCYAPNAIREAVEEFRRNGSAGLVYGDTIKVDETGRELLRQSSGDWSLENWFLIKTWIPQPSCFFRRELLAACGGWDPDVPYAADTDLWLRFVFRTEVRKIQKFLSERRIHAEQRDQQAARIYRDYCLMIDRSPDVASAPGSVRRAARAGRHILYRRYNPTGSLWHAFFHDVMATMVFPGSVGLRRYWVNGVVIPCRIMLQPLSPLKRWLGCWANERIRAEMAMDPVFGRLSRLGWQDICNRNELAVPGDDPSARLIESEYTSYLTVARRFPEVGGRLAKCSFKEYPLPILGSRARGSSANPVVTVILPVGGVERLENFRLVLDVLQNQTQSDIEYLVVEESEHPQYRDALPTGVRHLHQRSKPGRSFNKSSLLNLGVRNANAPVVLLHDVDIVVPANYVEVALRFLDRGFDAVRPIRFLFYLDKTQSARLRSHTGLGDGLRIPVVTQNSQGGSTLVRRAAYMQIGGHDESFEGWGGEDVEFLDRLKTLRLFRGGFMPALHLWHKESDGKSDSGKNLRRLSNLRKKPVGDRIKQLAASIPN